MKMNDLVQEALSDYDIATIGRNRKDSADDDEHGMDTKATDAMSARLMKATDYPDGDTITTDDGKSFKVGQRRASTIRGVLTDDSIKPNDRLKLDKMLRTDGDTFAKVMEPKDPKVLQDLLMQMMGEIDRPEKSNY